MQVTIHCHPKLMAKISIYNQLNLRRRRDFFFPIDNYMFKIGQAGLLFCLCPVFSTTILQKNIDFSRIRTRIVRVEGECADHLTTTTDLLSQSLSSRTSFERISFRWWGKLFILELIIYFSLRNVAVWRTCHVTMSTTFRLTTTRTSSWKTFEITFPPWTQHCLGFWAQADDTRE